MSDKLLVWLSVEVSGNDTKLGIGLGRNEKPRIVETKSQSRLLELQVAAPIVSTQFQKSAFSENLG